MRRCSARSQPLPGRGPPTPARPHPHRPARRRGARPGHRPPHRSRAGRTEMLFRQRGGMTPQQYERAGSGWGGFLQANGGAAQRDQRGLGGASPDGRRTAKCSLADAAARPEAARACPRTIGEVTGDAQAPNRRPLHHMLAGHLGLGGRGYAQLGGSPRHEPRITRSGHSC
jgi:hypothetical protein